MIKKVGKKVSAHAASNKENLKKWAPWVLPIFVGIFVIFKYADPEPPRHLVISTGNGEGDYQAYAKQYQKILKDDGVDLEIRPSSGAAENYKRLNDPNSDVDVGFVQDGLGSDEEAPDLSSLGSLYYEPIWIFYRSPKPWSRLSDLTGKKVAIGPEGGGTRTLMLKLLTAHGVTQENAKLLPDSWTDAAKKLEAGNIDAAAFLGTPDETLIKELVANPRVRLMSLDQAEAISRQIPYLHHLVLPHGSMDLKRNLPAQDVDMVSPTATLLVRDGLHSALAYLLLKAISQVHGEPGIFEKKDEFPIDKDYEFPLSDDAKHYYKAGTPFWNRYLPFWLANLVERFILVVIPTMALILPLVRLFPRFTQWRAKTRIYRRYGELKFLENQVKPDISKDEYEKLLDQLDRIEENVQRTKLPIDFSDHLYGLRGHIDFVRARIRLLMERVPG